MNQVILVGKVVSEVEYVSLGEEERVPMIILAVKRDNSLPDDQIQRIPLILSAKIVMIGREHIGCGKTIGVQGHLHFTQDSISVRVNKISFLEISG